MSRRDENRGRAQRDDVHAATYHTLVALTLDGDVGLTGGFLMPSIEFEEDPDLVATQPIVHHAEDADRPSPPPTPETPSFPEQIGDRYVRRELLGRGGMGEVWRVWDTQLERAVACKVLFDVRSTAAVERFEEEARVSAQLQHPGILPVHDLGTLEDGRLWFTMKEVEGYTLGDLVETVHRDWRMGREGPWSFRRLLEGMHRVCETVAYAHARGVVHRDIKPSNIMFGAYGEISVLDWGIAKVLGTAAEALLPVTVPSDRQATQFGVVSGTPNYMSPEQAQGRSADVGPAADVFSLGATLFDLLTDRPPRVVKGVRPLLFQVATGEPPVPPPSSFGSGAPVDELLDAIVMRSLATDEAERYPDAGALADDLGRWLDGSKKRERARALVREARGTLDSIPILQSNARECRRKAATQLDGVARNASIAEKLPAWELEREATEKDREAHDARTHGIQLLRAALSHDADLPEAHRGLADVFHRQHQHLEQAGEHDDARSVLAELGQHDREEKFASYLRGTGTVTLHTDVPAQVKLHRFVEVERQLKPVFVRDLGRTPLCEEPLEMGSYLLTLHAPGREVVRYPVWIRREEDWTGIPPDEAEPRVIHLPKLGDLEADDCYVPAGWFWAGDDFFEHTLPLQRAWSEAFVMKKFPVTIGEYVDFLNDLLTTKGEEAALAMAPALDALQLFGRHSDGRFLGLADDLEGLESLKRRLDLPVTGVTFDQADTYVQWLGAEYLLPTDLQRQRALRGADQRDYPWGDQLDPTLCNMRWSFRAPTITPVHTFSTDSTLFEVRGLAGNVAEWLGGPVPGWTGGGRCSSGPKTCMAAQRDHHQKKSRYSSFLIGLRPIRRVESPRQPKKIEQITLTT